MYLLKGSPCINIDKMKNEAADRPFDINKKMKITNKTLFLLADMFQLLYQHNTNWQYHTLPIAKGQGRDEVLCDDELLCDDE